MYGSNNEFSLDLFTDYRIQDTSAETTYITQEPYTSRITVSGLSPECHSGIDNITGQWYNYTKLTGKMNEFNR